MADIKWDSENQNSANINWDSDVVETPSNPVSAQGQPPPAQGVQGQDTQRKIGVLEEILRRLKGAGEVGATMASSMIAEPLAGYEGIEKGLVEGVKTGSIDAGAQAASEAVEQTRERFTYQPKSEEGKAYLEGIGGALEGVGELFQKLEEGAGDKVFAATESPALAALATTAPTLALEAIGMAAGPAATASLRKLKNLKQSGKITKMIKEATPDRDMLFDTASKMFEEIDDTGAVIKASAFDKMVDSVDTKTRKGGRNKRITPFSEASIKELRALKGKDIKITDLDTQRKIAQAAAKSKEFGDSARGLEIIDGIDDLINNLDETDFKSINNTDINIGAKYATARNLWGRARKSELIENSFVKANLKDGFEKNVKTEFNKILQNDKKRKFFNKEEIDAMTQITKPGSKQNIYDFASRFELNSKNIWTPLMGMSTASYFFGTAGAAIPVPIIGAVSKSLAARLTLGNAQFADQVIRAGRNAPKIAKAYLENTAPKLRSAKELSELLMRPDIGIDKLPKNILNNEAKRLVLQGRDKITQATTLTGTLAAPEIKGPEINE